MAAISSVSNALQLAYKKSSGLCKEVKTKLKPIHMLGKEIRSTSSLVGCFRSVPTKISSLATLTKITYPLAVPANIFETFDSFKEAVAPGKSPRKRVRSFTKSGVSANKVVDGVANTLEILYKFSAIGRKAVRWIPFFQFINLGFEVVDLGLTAETLHKARKTYQAVSKEQKKLSENTSNETKASILKDKVIVKIGKKERDLMLSKEAKESVITRIEKAAETLTTDKFSETDKNDAVSSGKKILESLKKRAKLHLGLTSLSLVNTIFTVTAIAALVFSSFIPVAAPIIVPIALATLICTTAVALGQWVATTFFIKRDPFDENAKMPIQELPGKAKKTCHEIVEKIRSAPAKVQSLFSRSAPAVA